MFYIKNEENKETGMTDDEVVAILAHELGHWKLWHTIYNLIILEVIIFKYNYNLIYIYIFLA